MRFARDDPQPCSFRMGTAQIRPGPFHLPRLCREKFVEICARLRQGEPPDQPKSGPWEKTSRPLPPRGNHPCARQPFPCGLYRQDGHPRVEGPNEEVVPCLPMVERHQQEVETRPPEKNEPPRFPPSPEKERDSHPGQPARQGVNQSSRQAVPEALPERAGIDLGDAPRIVRENVLE